MRGSNLLAKFSEIEKKKIEKFKKSIPAKVFYNHFDAASFYIKSDSDRYNLKKIDFYNNLKIKNTNFNLDNCKKLLWNSWSTENAFNASISGDEFYKFALHWHFPQAYYSIYLSMTAFHETQGVANENHEKSIKLFGNSIKDGHYPKGVSYYANGLYKDFTFYGINNLNSADFNSLTRIENITDAELQIKSFLSSTREQNAKNKRKRGEKEFSKQKDFQNQKGVLVKSFRKKHWDLIYKRIPETTLLNLIYRLRIKANYHDIKTFIDAELDFKKFHEILGEIISYLNFIHEAYFCKAVGIDKYEKILNDFEGHILKDKAKGRFEIIKNKLNLT